MPKLWELAKLVRAKNAGPFTLTIDIVFDDPHIYAQVKRSGVLTPALFARLYNVSIAEVQFFEHDRALALKASIPRPVASGDLADCDVFGGQQHAPLVDLEIPLDKSAHS
jgi:hypothetical protein